MGQLISFKFEELVVYQKAIVFVDKIYSLTKRYPHDEMFGLTGQLRRAEVSISLNIAEGSARTKKEFNRFLDTARGSVFECVTILRISLKQNYISKSEFEELKEYLVEISKMLSGLKHSLTQQTRTTDYELRTTNKEV
jgi:four helix bundle protein